MKNILLKIAFSSVFVCAGILFLLLALDKIPVAKTRDTKHVVATAETTPETTSIETIVESGAIQTELQKETLAEETSITISLTGDCTFGTDEYFDQSTSFNAYYNMYGAEYFFQNVRDTFAADDLTIVNFEGTLTTETTREDKQFAFKADPSYASILTAGSVEAVTLANNHSHDYGEQSYTDTQTALKDAEITSFGYDKTALLDVKGLNVGLVGIYELDEHLGIETQLKQNIQSLKDQNADLIIVIFHWGNEKETSPDDNEVTLGHLAIDEGADLVVGHHPHVLQKLETYKGKTIAYSLANFCFGGNTHPTDFDTIILQQTFTFDTSRTLTDTKTNVIPCQISSTTEINNYQPTLLSGSEADRVLQKLADLGSEWGN